MITRFNPTGMELEELMHWRDSGQVTGTIKTMLDAKIKGKQASLKRSQASAPAKPAAAPAPAAQAAAGVDRSALDAASAEWVKGQHADIDRGAEQNLAKGMSNMIGSGLAGTTAVGGMTAAVGEAATRAKTNVSGQAKMQTEGLALQYAGLAQGASEGAANRAFQSSEGALNRASSEKMGTMSASNGGSGFAPSAPSTPGLDAFGSPMAGSVQAMGGGQGGLAQKYPNLSAAAPDIFKF